jgi:sortase A
VYHGAVKRLHPSRLLRRVSSCLIIVGGIVLAYPFWSAGYAALQQDRLSGQLPQVDRAFARAASADAAVIRAITNRDAKMRALAALFAKHLKPGEAIGRLSIPAIGLSKVVLEGDHKAPSLGVGNDQSFLRDGPTHYGLTPLPGAGRPFAVAGHRTTYGAPFFSLNRLHRGDLISMTTPYGRFTYRVAKWTVVLPGDTSVLWDRGYDLVLTTCHPPYSAARRLIVWAMLVGFTFR